MTSHRGWTWLLVGLLVLQAGCTSAKKKKSAATVREEVAEGFDRLKEAIAEVRKGETERFWELLAEESRAEAAKKAKAFRIDFAKRDKEEQADIAQQLRATAEEIRDKLNGYGYVRMMASQVYDRYWMIVAAEIDHVQAVDADEATVYYTQDDSERDKKSIDFVREDGRWRAVLRIP